MSTLAAKLGFWDKENATPFENNASGSIEGQRHDRYSDDVPLSEPPTEHSSGRDHNGDIDITASQKILSAMSGSLLTSLIGTLHKSLLLNVPGRADKNLQLPLSMSFVSVSSHNQVLLHLRLSRSSQYLPNP